MSDGGPAFPVTQFVDDPLSLVESTHRGMSLRDWFAGQALALGGEFFYRQCGDVVPVNIASVAYELADAMLAERTNGGAR